ncbi:unnamed protein product, partial [marine sediment metagenome]
MTKRIEYNISFYRGDLKSDIANRLKEDFPRISTEKSFTIADMAIDGMLREGNGA